MTNPATIIRVSAGVEIADYSYSKTCLYCGDDIIFTMTKEEYRKWKIELNYIQHVFPHLDSGTKESMISGTHPDCWDQIFVEEDEAEFVDDYNEIINSWKP